MKVNELRIGNWVMNPNKLPVKIDSINHRGDILLSNYEPWKVIVEDVSPLPLTKEILLKSGFETPKCNPAHEDVYARPVNYDYKIEPYFFIVDVSKKHIMVRRETELLCVKYQYVHELQNLWFELTKTEWRVKL